MSRWDLRMFLRYDAGGKESGSSAHTSSSLNGEGIHRMQELWNDESKELRKDAA